MKLFRLIFIFTSFLLLHVEAASEHYTVAIVPQLQTVQIEKSWQPFLNELTKQTGIEFDIKYYATIPLFEKGLKNGEADMAFMNPYHAVMAYDWKNYKPIIHDKKPLVGILVVKKESPIHSISELNGKTIAFPAPNAFAASLFMRALLQEDEKISITPVYVKTHSNVYRDVIFGLYTAGGGVNNTLTREAAGVSSQLRVLYTTKPTASHPLCVSPKIPEKSVMKIRDAILKMGKNPEFKSMLNEIQIPNPVVADYKTEYLPLKKLKLENYVVLEN